VTGAAELDAVRADVRAWLEDNWHPDRPLLEWRSLLADSGWGCPTWPVEHYGRGLPPHEAAPVGEEFARVGAVGVAAGSAMSLAAPTILAHGSDELKRRLLRPILTGEARWCQLFSEPGNGSDLAGLTTRAVRDGDEWVVNGQKVWTTGAKKAAYGMLLARTNMDAPKHRGITYFAFPMRQEGVDVRPLKQANGHASFNEVFLTDARVPHANVIGDADTGWPVALTTLSHERGLAARAGARVRTPSGRTAREAAEEAAEYNTTYVWYPQRAGRADLLVPQAQAMGRSDDAVTRQQVAATIAFERAARWTAQRSVAARAQGRPPGPEGSLGKLSGSEIARRSARVHGQVAGAHGMLAGDDGLLDGTITEILVSVPAQSIAGGTDEIQHNIIGERVLGLPKEPAVDVDIPFRDVRTNADRHRHRT
jgi:alkylation response protein AidB-like acyl-CoA dehydrogenase